MSANIVDNIQVQRQRVRDSMFRVNAVGVSLRTINRLHRRNYRVAGPNSLWHIDGNHKLIRLLACTYYLSTVVVGVILTLVRW